MIGGFDGEWSFLSNFHECPVELGGVVYGSAEAAYQAQKYAGDRMVEKRVRSAFSRMKPSEAKAVGGLLPLREGWLEGLRDETMRQVVTAKFAGNSDLRRMLADTGNEELVELNYWHDRHFGVCSCASCGGTGDNVLGRILMDVRIELSSVPELPSAMDVVRHIVCYCRAVGKEVRMIPLQAMLYCIRRECLRRGDGPGFEGRFVAMSFGPAVKEVYDRFCGFGSYPIEIFGSFCGLNSIGTLVSSTADRIAGLQPWDIGLLVRPIEGAWERSWQDGNGEMKPILDEAIRNDWN